MGAVLPAIESLKRKYHLQTKTNVCYLSSIRHCDNYTNVQNAIKEILKTKVNVNQIEPSFDRLRVDRLI